MFVDINNRLYLNAPASVMTKDEVAKAEHSRFSWAEEYMNSSDTVNWILAKYVEADRPNSNGQMWTFADLVEAQDTIQYSPMNVLHRSQPVGVWVQQNMIYPLAESGEIEHPYVEVLGALWSKKFPQVAEVVEAAYAEGSLFISMECIPETVTWKAEGFEDQTYPWVGMRDESYGPIQHVAGAACQLNKPRFMGGALIVPPVRPGWSGARVLAIANDIVGEQKVTEILDGIRLSMPDDVDEEKVIALASDFLAKRFEEIASTLETEEAEEFNSATSEPNIELEEEIDDPQGGVDVMEELEIANKRIADLEAQLAELKSAADAQANEAELAKLAESHEAALEEKNAEVAAAKAETDAAILRAEQAEAEHKTLVEYLEAEKVAAEEAAAAEARKEERIAQVKEVASLSDERISQRADEWAALSDEAFASLVEDLAAVASKQSTSTDTGLPMATAMQHAGSSDMTSNSNLASLHEMIRAGKIKKTR